MNVSLLQSPSLNLHAEGAETDFDVESAKPFSVVVVYDNNFARLKAMELYSRLLRQFGSELQFECHSWGFAQLAAGDAEKAADGAAAASLIIIATAVREDLPFQFKMWIERWLAKTKQLPAGLIALVGREQAAAPAERCPVQKYLQVVAAEASLAFFTGEFPLPEHISSYSVDELVARSEMQTSVMQEILSRRTPPPRWGINE